MSDEGYYDSDEGFCGPSDDEGYDPWHEEVVGGSPSGEKERGPSNTLSAFRKDWFNDLDDKSKRRADASSRPPQPDTVVSRVLLNPLLLRRIFSSAQFSRQTLSALSLVSAAFCDAAQASIFRKVTLNTVKEAEKLVALFESNPFLSTLPRELILSLGNPTSLALEVDSIAEHVAAKRAEEDAQEEAGEVFYLVDHAGAGRSRAVPRWRYEIWQSLSSPSDAGVTAARRRSHLKHALSKEGSKKLVKIAINQQWPFNLSSPTPPALSVLSTLAPAITTLSVTFPLSHRFASFLLPILPLFANLRSFSFAADIPESLDAGDSSVVYADVQRAEHGGPLQIEGPSAHLQMQSGGRGLRELEAAMEDLSLSSVVLWIDENAASSDSLPPSTSSRLRNINFRKVVCRRLSADDVHEAEQQPIRVTFPQPEQAEPATPPLAHPSFSLDVYAFSRPSLDAPPPLLTSLALIDVDGVLLSSISRLIASSASHLIHLHLENLNIGTSSPTRLSRDIDFNRFAEYVTSWQLRTFSNDKSRAPLDFRRRQFAKVEAAARRLPPKQRFHPDSEEGIEAEQQRLHPLFEALSLCTSLETLRLTVDTDYVKTSPFPPSLLGALLAARPPLRTLHWTVGVEGPRKEDGLMEVEEWLVFAKELEKLGRWESFVPLKSEVVLDARW